ncbi:hypothetical protein KABACHOK_01150 [Brevundimonas phage vB_BpoS-Kabachok]|uniref:Uncharacterized protein n=1 Tax=Brevundimonas phage vB_BpoS-Kabachok TaxID=2948600 RepID=A0A9E7MNJ5_9CAUD|nr:hypothetical protein KABACHOK_01150 [Brevundimonas phage vB_BpoS-Kabachok]
MRTTDNPRDAVDVLRHLVDTYACDESVVGHPINLARLPQLRMLERCGLVEIREVVLNKRWVTTAAGAIWLTLREAGLAKTVRLDDDILNTQKGFWMSRTEAVCAAILLERQGLAQMTNATGGGVDYPSFEPLHLTYTPA